MTPRPCTPASFAARTGCFSFSGAARARGTSDQSPSRFGAVRTIAVDDDARKSDRHRS
jgi:hypothetical protein